MEKYWTITDVAQEADMSRQRLWDWINYKRLLPEPKAIRPGNPKRLFYTDAQIFNRPPTRQIAHKKFSAGQAIAGFDSLTPGDYVVHVDHGIGAFIGVERVNAGQGGRDCMVIR